MRYPNSAALTLLLPCRAETPPPPPAPTVHALSPFPTPSPLFAPKFRYWLPDASASVDSVVRDIHAIADVGAGGIEWLPYYQLRGDQSSDWAAYGYGSAAFVRVNRAAFQAAAERGIVVDFAVGANQGQGVPSVVGTGGLAVHLVSFYFTYLFVVCL